MQHSNWPISREPEERVVNPSPDKQLQDHLVDEILVCLEKKDSPGLRDALKALIENIRNEGMDDGSM